MTLNRDSHDLFGECFLLTKSFVVLVQPWSEGRMLEKSCVGHRAFETVVGKTCWCLCLCHSKDFEWGASFPAFRFCSGLGESTPPTHTHTVSIAPGSTPAVFPRYRRVTGRGEPQRLVLRQDSLCMPDSPGICCVHQLASNSQRSASQGLGLKVCATMPRVHPS